MYTNIWITITLLISFSFAIKLPSDIELCKAEDVACISKLTTEILNKNPNGRSDLGIPKLDPFRLNALQIKRGNGGSFDLNLSFKDLDITGLSKLTVYNATGFTKDPYTSKFELQARAPRLQLKGLYKASGRILVLPIQGDGNAEIILDNVDFAVKFKPSINKIDNQSYLAVDKLKILLTPSRLTMKLDNLFNGDKILGDNLNIFINENWQDVWEELSPSVNSAIVDILKNLMKNVFTKFSYEEIYKS